MNLKADELARTDPATNDTVSAILDAGAACLARYGNEKTSIQDIADTAGMSRATVYRYFPDRASLLRAVTRHDQAKQADEIRRADHRRGHLRRSGCGHLPRCSPAPRFAITPVSTCVITTAGWPSTCRCRRPIARA